MNKNIKNILKNIEADWLGDILVPYEDDENPHCSECHEFL